VPRLVTRCPSHLKTLRRLNAYVAM
jgi:hypothetical protein